MILSTVADIGLMLHLFLLGVQIDVTMLKKAGRSAMLIGTIGFALAIVLGGLALVTLANVIKLDDKLLRSLPVIVAVNSISSFPVTTSLLADLNILNSEMGRLASFTSMVGDLCSYFVTTVMAKVTIAIRTSQWGLLWSLFWIAVYLLAIVFLLRPLILLVANRIPEGTPIKESHFIFILVILFACGFCAEVLGQHSGVGSFILGMVVPDGPPFGESLVYKLEAISTGLLLPAKFVITGLIVNLSSIKSSSAAIVELIIISGYIGKFLGTLATSYYCSVPLGDAVCLSLVMCCKGVIDISVYIILVGEGVVDHQVYTLLILTMLVITGMSRILVGHLYDPSRRYMVQTTRSSIQDSRRHNVDLRMLVCIHNEDHVPTIINLLEASNPTKNSPISIFVLNLMELKGRAAAVLVPNFRKGRLTSTAKHSKHIVNAFSYYARENQDSMFLQHFTAMAPYSSMHDDICTLALDANVNILILPFHKQWTVDGKVGNAFHSIQIVNQNVINKAPCSVGVLVDRHQITGFLTGQFYFRIALLFLGGADDREALAYASRMADHPKVTLTVAWIRMRTNDASIRKETVGDPDPDIETMDEFRANVVGKKRIVFKEEKVEDAVGTTEVIHSMEDGFDLFMVGRHHDPYSPLTLGLTDWSECPELGVIGDMLASSDFRFSVLVVQQQPIGTGFLNTNLIRPISSCKGASSRVVHQDSPDTEQSIRSENNVW